MKCQKSARSSIHQKSPPSRGAWIEILKVMVEAAFSGSPPLAGGVD